MPVGCRPTPCTARPPTASDRVTAVYDWLGDVADRSAIRALHDAVRALETGVSTPLEIVFSPPGPAYPLKISSLHAGETRIEVYVAAETPVVDRNGVLAVDISRRIDAPLRDALAGRVDLTGAQYVTRLNYRGDLADLIADAEFARAGDTEPKGVARQLATTPTAETRTASPQRSDADLRSLALEIARDPATPAAVLALLADNEAETVRFLVAGNESTSLAALERLADDTSDAVREEVARHPHVSSALLEKLATDPYEEVRFEVVAHPNAPAAALAMLAKSASPKMRAQVARHPNTPTDVLSILAQDADEHVASSARAELARRDQDDDG